MKKISVVIILAILFSMLTMINVSAVEPQWAYECNKLVVPVTIDGKVDGNEWDDAVALVVNNDNEIFKQFGIWQADADNPIPSSKLSVTYRVKWDENNLYILEERFDTAFSFIPDAADDWPWSASGTLFFLCYDADYSEPSTDGCYEIFWVINPDGGAPKLTGRGPGKSELDADEIAKWTVATSASGDVYTIEVAVPWSAMQSLSGFPAPSEGLKLRFTPVIAAFHEKTTESFDNWNQLDFYCDPEIGSPDNPESNGGMILKGVNYTPPAVDEPEAPVDVDTGDSGDAVVDVPVTVAPPTGDSNVLFISLIILIGVAVIINSKLVLKNKKVN